MKKRILAIVLAFALCFSFTSTFASAASAGVVKVNGKIMYRYSNGTYAKDKLVRVGKYYYYFQKNGVRLTGPKMIRTNNAVYFINSNGTMAVNGWKVVNKLTYYFGSNGKMYTGVKRIGSYYYNFRSNGVRTGNAVVKYGASYLYFEQNGAMTGKTKGLVKTYDGKSYYIVSGKAITNSIGKTGTVYRYFGSNGVYTGKQNGVKKVANGNTYYLKNSIAYLDKIITVGNYKRYFQKNGAMFTGTAWITTAGKVYYFTKGVLTTGVKKIGSNNYYLNPDRKTGLQKIGTKYYYYDANGRMKKGLLAIGGKKYYFAPDRKTGWQTISGARYYFIPSTSVMATGDVIIDGVTNHFGTDGKFISAAKDGIVAIGGEKFFYKNDVLVTDSMVAFSGKKYYAGTDGALVSNVAQEIEGFYYIFGADCALVTTQGWYEIGTDKYYLEYSDGIAATGTIEIDGVSYNFDNDGKLHVIKNGIYEENGKKYFYLNDQKRSGVRSFEGKDYYFSPDNFEMMTGMVSIGQNSFLFGEDGVKVTQNGISDYSGKKYYIENTVVKTGVIEIDGESYFFNPEMKTGWQKTAENEYRWFNDLGVQSKMGWYTENDETHYYDMGVMLTGWQTISGAKYYFSETGDRITGYREIDGKDYVFNDAGVMKVDTVVELLVGDNAYDYYAVDETGEVIKNAEYDGCYYGADGKALKGLQTINGSLYYLAGDGFIQTGWYKIVDTIYYFGADGKAVTGIQTIGDTTYNFGTDGICTDNTAFTGIYVTAAGAMTYYENGKTASSKTFPGKWFTDLRGYKFYAKAKTAKLNTITIGVDGNTYRFNKYSGRVMIGVVEVEGFTFYYDKDGVNGTGLQIFEGKKYYFDTQTGYMLSNCWLELDGNQYYIDSTGAFVTGNYRINGLIHYFDSEGVYFGNEAETISYKIFDPSIWIYKSDGVTVKSSTLNEDWDKYVVDIDNLVPALSGAGWFGNGEFEVDSTTTVSQGLVLDNSSNSGYVTFKLSAPEGMAFKTANLIINARECMEVHGTVSISKSKNVGYTDIFSPNEAAGTSGKNVTIDVTDYVSGAETLYVSVNEPASISDWSQLWYLAADVSFREPDPKNGWIYDDNDNAFYYENDVAATGWKTIGEFEYYFDTKGIMQKNTRVDGKKLDSEGHYVADTVAGSAGFKYLNFSDPSSQLALNVVKNSLTSREITSSVGEITSTQTAVCFNSVRDSLEYTLDFGKNDKPVTLEITEIHQRTDGAINYSIYANNTKIYTRAVDPSADGENHYFVEIPTTAFNGTALTIKIAANTAETFRISEIFNYYDLESLLASEETYNEMPVTYMPGLASIKTRQELAKYNTLDGFTYGNAVELYYMSANLSSLYKSIDGYVKISAETGTTFGVGTNSWWGGTPGGPDGEGGYWQDMRYQQVVYDPMDRSGYAQNGYQLSTPNRYGSTPWLTMNDDNYNNARNIRLKLLTEYMQKAIAEYKANTGKEASLYIYTENEPEYWAFHRHYGGNGSGDFNQSVIEDAKADGITLDYSDGLTTAELKWLEDNMTDYISQLGRNMQEGIQHNTVLITSDGVSYPSYQLGENSYTHTLTHDQFPEMFLDNYDCWERHIIKDLRFGCELYEYTCVDDLAMAYIAAYGTFSDINAERGGVSDSNVRKSALQMYYTGSKVYNIYNADSSREYNILSQIDVNGKYDDSIHENGYAFTYKQMRARNLLVCVRADVERLLSQYVEKNGEDANYDEAFGYYQKAQYNTAYDLLVKYLSETLPARYALRGTNSISAYGIGYTTSETVTTNLTIKSIGSTSASLFIEGTEPITLTFTVDAGKYSLKTFGNNLYTLAADDEGTKSAQGKVSFTVTPGNYDPREYLTSMSGLVTGKGTNMLKLNSQDVAYTIYDQNVEFAVAADVVCQRAAEGEELQSVGFSAIKSDDYVEVTFNANHEINTIKAWYGNVTGTVVSVSNVRLGESNDDATVTVNVGGTNKTFRIGGNCSLSYIGLPTYVNPDSGNNEVADSFATAYYAENLGMTIGMKVTVIYEAHSYNGKPMSALSIRG